MLIYVLDTNVLLDYPDVIFDKTAQRPKNPTIDLDGTHLVIPSAVIRELESFKREKNERGKTARILLKRLRGLLEKDDILMSDYEVYHLCPIKIHETHQRLSILPVHGNFTRMLPFKPSDEDMDGQIILTALSVIAIKNGKDIDGEMKWAPGRDDSIVLLTNDNGLAIRARERGIKTSRYGYKRPEPYTGRRDLVVPKELFDKLYFEHMVPREEFERLMPEERRLIANEFIIMTPEDLSVCTYFSPQDDPGYSHVGRYDVEENAILPLKFVRSFPVKPMSVGQALYMEALANSNISAVICTGPAGSGKTYIATIYGYLACLVGRFIGIAVVPCEDRSKIGALPGDLSDKMDPRVQPFKNAIRNYLLNEDPSFKRRIANLQKYGCPTEEEDEDIEERNEASDNCKNSKGHSRSQGKCKNKKKRRSNTNTKSVKSLVDEQVNLIWRNWFSEVPIENARGQDFAYQLAIYDEFQDQNIQQADTLIKRIGNEGKIILAGDIEQIHAPYLDDANNGIVYASGLLFDDPMVAQVHFSEEDVVRHPLVKLIAERQARAKIEPENI